MSWCSPLDGAIFMLQVWAWFFGGTTVVGTVKMRIDHYPETDSGENGDKLLLNLLTQKGRN